MANRNPRKSPHSIADEPAQIVQGRRSMTFSGCSTAIETETEDGLSAGEFAGMAIALAGDNPDARFYFSLKLYPASAAEAE